MLHRYIEEGLPKPFRTLPKWLAFALAGATTLALAMLTGTGLAFSLREGHVTNSLAALAVAATLAGAGAAILSGLQARPRRALAASLFVLLSGAEILWRNAASPLNAEPLERYSVYAGMKPAEAAGIEVLRRRNSRHDARRRPSARRDIGAEGAVAECLDGPQIRKYARL